MSDNHRSALNGRRILLGVSGSIAAYKAVGLLRELLQSGAVVDVVMTQAACRFVAPLTFEVLSGRRVYIDLFERGEEIRHIELAEAAEIILLAPATADLLSKMAVGAADDLLSAVLLAARGSVVVAPAMDGGMWEHPAVQANVDQLRARRVTFVPPETGPLASGRWGMGRLASEKEILQAVERRLSAGRDFAGTVVLVTAGPTREPIDPVRCLTNRSSGKMGYAMARAAAERGAEVILVSGPVSLDGPPGVQTIRVETAAEMRTQVRRHLSKAEILVMAAAVSDFQPARMHPQKIKKGGGLPALALSPTTDILAEIADLKARPFLVGFAAETESLESHAQEKRRKKKLDLVIANDVTQEGAGFETETNIVTVIGRDGKAASWPKLSKIELAHRILDRIQLERAGPRRSSK